MCVCCPFLYLNGNPILLSWECLCESHSFQHPPPQKKETAKDPAESIFRVFEGKTITALNFFAIFDHFH